MISFLICKMIEAIVCTSHRAVVGLNEVVHVKHKHP